MAAANVLQPLIDVLDPIIKFLHDTVGLNWALAIIALTFIVRAAMVPITLRGIRSMRRMQILAPRMKELQAKYQKSDPQRFQREVMELYRKEGVNPLSSCLTFALQIPIFIALYGLLRGSGFKSDVLASGSPGGLGVHSVVANPEGAELIILIALFIVSTIASMQVTMSMNPTATPGQRYIMYLFPLMIVPFMANAPAGLSVYWIASSVWTLGQQYVVQRVMPPPPQPAPEEARKAKPPPPPPRKRKRRR